MTEESGDTLGFNVKVLSELGLSGDEAVAYAILVGTGARTAEEVSIYSGRPVSEIKDALIRLSEKGYARRIAGVLDVYQSLNPQIVISSAAEEQLETELNRTISDINDMWKYGADLLNETTSKFNQQSKTITDEKLSVLQNTTANTNNTISQTVQKLKVDLKDLVDKTGTQASQMTTNDYNALNAALQTLRTVLSDETQRQISTLEASMAELAKKTTELIDGSSTQLKTRTEDSAKAFNTKISEVREETTTSINNFDEKIDTIVSDLNNQIEEQRRNLTASVTQVGQTTIDNFNSSLETLHGMFSKSVVGLIAQINTHIDSLLLKTTTRTDANVNDHANAVTSAKARLQTSQDTISQAFQNVRTALESITQYNDSTQTALEDLQAKTRQVLENLNTLEISLIQKSEDFPNNTARTLQEGLKEGINSLQEGLQNAKATLTQFVDDTTTSWKGSSEQFTEDTMAAVTSKQEILLSTLDNFTSSTQEQAKTKTNEAQNNISTEKETVLNALEAQLQGTKAKMDEHINRMSSAVDDTLNALDEVIKSQVKAATNTFQDQFNARKTQIEEEINQCVDQINANETEASTKLDNLLKEMTDTITQLRTTSTEDVSRSTQERAEQLKAHLAEFSKGLDETLRTFAEKTEQESGALRQEIPPALDRLVIDHKNRIQTFDLTFSESLTRIIEMVSEIHEKLQDKKERKKLHETYLPRLEEMKKNLTTTQGKLRTLIEGHVSTFETESSRFIDQIERSLTLQIRAIQDLAEQSQEKVDTARKDAEVGVESGLSAAKTLFLDGLQQTVEQNLQTAENGINQANTTLQNIANMQTTLFQGFRELLTTQEQELSTGVEGLRTGTEQQLNTSVERIKSNQHDILSQARIDFLKTVDSVHTQTKTLAEKISGTALQLDETLLTQMLDLMNSQHTRIQGAFDNFRQNVSDVKETRKAELQTQLEEMASSKKETLGILVTEALTTLQATADQKIAQLPTMSAQLSQSHKEEIAGTLRDSSQIYETTTETIAQGLSDLISSFNQDMMPAIERANAAFSTDLSGSLENVDSTLNNSHETIKLTAEAFKETMNEIPQMTAGMERDHEKMNSDLQFNVENTISALRNEVLSNENKMHSFIGTRTDEAKATVDQLQKEELPQMMHAVLNEKLDHAIEAVNLVKEEVHTSIESERQNLRTQAETATAIPFRNIQTNALDFQKSLEEELSSHDLSINKHLFEYAEKLRATLEANYTQTTGILDSSENSIKETLTSNTNDIQNTLQELTTGVNSSVETIQSDVTKKLTGAIRGIPERVHAALKTTGSTMTFLKQVHDFALKTKPLAIEQTYPIFGKDAVLNGILGCLTRVKSTINVVLPTLGDIPLDTLEAVPRTRRIEIITGESSITPEYVSDLANAAPNVVIRKIPEVDVYMAFRDAEEVILGTGEGEGLAAVATTQDAFVRLLSELQARFRAQSRPA